MIIKIEEDETLKEYINEEQQEKDFQSSEAKNNSYSDSDQELNYLYF